MLHLFASRILWENSLGQLSSEIFSQFVKIKKKKDVIFFYVAEILIIRDVDAKQIFKIPDFIIYSFQK